MQLPCVLFESYISGFLLGLVCFRLKFRPLNPSLISGFKALNFGLKQAELGRCTSRTIKTFETVFCLWYSNKAEND